jgi:cytochrome c556
VRLSVLSWVVLAAVALAAPSAAQSSGQVIEDRIAGFRDIGSAFKNMGDELKSGRPNRARIQRGARVIAGYAPHVGRWFPRGTEPPPKADSWLLRTWEGFFPPPPQPGVPETHAKIEIWTQPAAFAQDLRRFQAAASAMHQAAQQGSVAQMTAQHRRLEAACSACHKTFREKVR